MNEDLSKETMRSNERGRQAGRGWTVAGFAMAVLAVVILPPVFGALGIVFGYMALRDGEKSGKAVIAASVVGAAIGMALAWAAFSAGT